MAFAASSDPTMRSLGTQCSPRVLQTLNETELTSYPLAIWLILIGVFSPPTMAVFVSDARLLPGRVAILLLLVPALIVIIRRRGGLFASDVLTLAMSIWIVTSSLLVEGTNSISSAGIEALEFGGAYFLGRGFVFGGPALMQFVRVLKFIIVILACLALIDIFTGRHFTIDFTAALFGQPPGVATQMETRSLFGIDIIRAQASLDHPILFGTVCALAAGVFLYSETTPLSRLLYYGLSALGCLLSASSAPLICLAILTSVYFYNNALERYSWKWKALWSFLAVMMIMAFIVANHPISWIISHFTFDPSSGYYRIMIWDIATAQISLSPLMGFGFILFDNGVLDTSVDSIWLVGALRFGLPMIVLLFLANISACLRSTPWIVDPYLRRMRTAFSAIIVALLFGGLTTHHWNGSWMFWGLCLGIRAALNEFALYQRTRQDLKYYSVIARRSA